MGAATMNWLSPTLLYLVAWAGLFAQTQFAPVRSWLGLVPGVLPTLLVYAAFTHPLGTSSTFAVITGLWLDSLSGNPLGVSVGPCFLVTFVLNTRQHLLLREQWYARFWLGLAAGVAIPLATLALLLFGGRPPYLGPGLAWMIGLQGLLNGILCPVAFRWFDTLRSGFEYQPVAPAGFRPDREIKRGRR